MDLGRFEDTLRRLCGSSRSLTGILRHVGKEEHTTYHMQIHVCQMYIQIHTHTHKYVYKNVYVSIYTPKNLVWGTKPNFCDTSIRKKSLGQKKKKRISIAVKQVSPWMKTVFICNLALKPNYFCMGKLFNFSLPHFSHP